MKTLRRATRVPTRVLATAAAIAAGMLLPTPAAALADSGQFGIDSNNLGALTPAIAQQNDVTFAVRYLSGTTSQLLDPTEAVAWTKANIDLVAVWETTRTRPVDGGNAAADFANGVADAQAADAQLKADGGAGAPIYFAVDAWVASDNFANLPPDVRIRNVDGVVPYFKGVQSVIGLDRTGAYGSYTLVHGLFQRGAITYGWESSSFDTRGQKDPRMQLYQSDIRPPDTFGSPQLDYDKSYAPDFGQWKSSLATPFRVGRTIG